MSKFISSVFKKKDLVVLKEDLVSEVYSKTFTKGHEFRVIDITPSGLVIEDNDGYRLMDVGFLRFEVSKARGDYMSNDSYAWEGYRR